ncbi:MAG TPA: uL22 family ribosomal protein [Elusimicrobiales bacterium]|nr:uL22 family ribosomal protein [Elusimicrobiales bacterium]
MDALAKAKFQRISQTKVSQLLNEVRGKNVTMAEYIAQTASKGATTLVVKTINSAAANLSIKLGKKLNPDEVWIKRAYADRGPMRNLQRIRPGPQGRAMPFRRKMCHLTIIVSDNRKEI